MCRRAARRATDDERRLFSAVTALAEAGVLRADAVILSDYAKGVLSPRVIRAVIANLSHPGQRPEGASGITQQVAKNFLLGNEARAPDVLGRGAHRRAEPRSSHEQVEGDHGHEPDGEQ